MPALCDMKIDVYYPTDFTAIKVDFQDENGVLMRCDPQVDMPARSMETLSYEEAVTRITSLTGEHHNMVRATLLLDTKGIIGETIEFRRNTAELDAICERLFQPEKTPQLDCAEAA